MARLITKHRRGTTLEWMKFAGVPEEGELLLEEVELCEQTDGCVAAQNRFYSKTFCPACNKHLSGISGEVKLKVGNGFTKFADLPYITTNIEDRTNMVESELSELLQLATEASADFNTAAEVTAARVSATGIRHPDLGTAIRSVENATASLRSELQQFIGADAVDGLIYDEKDSMLYLSAKNRKIEPGVMIVSGSGGSGSGEYSSTVVDITNNNGFNALTTVVGAKVELKFTFSSMQVLDETKIPSGACSCTITVNDRERVSGFSIPNGDQTIVDITEYLTTGTNYVRVVCTDLYGASRPLVYTINVVELRLESDFRDNTFFPAEQIIPYTYIPWGDVDKKIYFFIDGVNALGTADTFDVDEVPVKIRDDIYIRSTDNFVKVEQSASGIRTLTELTMSQFDSNPFHDVHPMTVFMTATVNGQTIVSNLLNYELMIVVEGKNQPLLASVLDTTEVQQGSVITIPYLLYDPASRDGVDNVIGTVYNSDGSIYKEYIWNDIPPEKQFWSTRDYPFGDNIKFKIEYNNTVHPAVSKTHTVNVTASKIQLKPIANESLYLTVGEKTNKDADRDSWTYKDVTTTFSGFNWQTNGWMNDKYDDKGNAIGDPCLRFNGAAEAVINYNLFKNDASSTGKTIELEYAIRHVNDRSAVAIRCGDSVVNLKATADTISISGGVTTLNLNYKDETRMKIGITIADDTTSGNRFLSFYLNGVHSACAQYDISETFMQTNKDDVLPIYIGSPYCEIDLYSIRVYDFCLTGKNMINNYLAELTDIGEKSILYTDNNIYTDSLSGVGTTISYETVYKILPTVTFVGEMPAFKGDKKKVRMIYHNPQNDSLDFDEVVEIDVQGTSSQGYVRKNWKTKLSSNKQHMADQLPAKVFCIKVDYAEGTGTHNTQNANFVETLYSEKVPPQDREEKIRTTIAGFPCVVFEKRTEDSNYVFSSKGNFNYDKDAENVFGFTQAYDTECWEFCNNTSDACNFLSNIPTDWGQDFEARYYPDEDLIGNIEDLQEAKDEAKKNGTMFPVEDQTALDSYRNEAIARFKQMHDWVVSTRQDAATGNKLDSDYVVGRVTYTHDTAEYRLAKFKNEFREHFNLHYATIYYLYTFFALMTDQRAKNMFLTYWKDVDGNGAWYPYFYDNDTSYGIDNKGHMAFDYYHEDIDVVAGGAIVKDKDVEVEVPSDEEKDDPQAAAYVYNGQRSVLWTNFRQAFPSEIANTYKQLRSDKKLTYDKLVDQVITQGADKWSAAIYNEDAEYKYLSIMRPNYVGDQKGNNYLYQVRGTGEDHFKYFVENRLMYCDSKFYAGDYPNDLITVRIYTPTFSEEQLADPDFVRPDPTLRIVPYSDMYVGVRYKANGYLQTARYLRQHNVDENGKQIPIEFRNIVDPVYITEQVLVHPETLQGITAQSISTDSNHSFSVVTPEDVTFTIIDAVNGVVQFADIPANCPTQEVETEVTGSNDVVSTVTTVYKVVEVSYYGYLDSESFNDTETFIYGASEISSLGDLSALYCDGLKVGNATKLTEVIVGSQKPGYDNPNLKEVSFGNNVLLKTVDVSNCSSLTGALDLTNCVNIEEVYASGTKIASVTLPDAGNVQKLVLPETIRTLTLRNQLHIPEDGLVLPSPTSLTNIWIENSSVDTTALLNSCLYTDENGNITTNLTNIRVDGLSYEFEDSVDDNGELVYSSKHALEFFKPFASKRGIDSDKPYLGGTIKLQTCSGEDFEELNSYFDGLSLEFSKLQSIVTFEDGDGKDPFYPKTLVINNPVIDNAVPNWDGVTVTHDMMLQAGIDHAPVRAQTAGATYKFAGYDEDGNLDLARGWAYINQASVEETVEPDPSALVKILGNRTLYPVFVETPRTYKVRFYSGNQVVYETDVIYDHYATYVGEDPVKTETTNPDAYDFTGWAPDPSRTRIKSETAFYAQFTFDEDNSLSTPLSSEFEYLRDDSGKLVEPLELVNYIALANDEPNDNDSMITIPNSFVVTDATSGVINKTIPVAGIGGFTPDEDTPVVVEFVKLPDGITSIRDNAFYQCDKLVSINIPESVTNIGTYSFVGCESLTTVDYNAKNVNIPMSGTHAPVNAPFLNVGSATPLVVNIGEKVKKIPHWLFYGANISQLNFAENSSLETIEGYAFNYSIQGNVKLPEGLKTIGLSAFSVNDFIKKITYVSRKEETQLDDVGTVVLPASVTSLEQCFENCSNLEELHIPRNVSYIQDGLVRFTSSSRSSKLRTVTVQEGSQKYISSGNCIVDTTDRAVIVGCRNSTIPANASRIASYAFSGATFTQFNIPGSTPGNTGITSIGQYAFSFCPELSSITIPDSVTSIGTSCFYSCNSLENVQLSANITRIPQYAFSALPSLTEIDIPDGVTEIGDNSFQHCTKLRSVVLPEALLSIRRNAFSDCVNLCKTLENEPGELRLPDSVTELRASAFSNCSNIGTVYLSSSIQEFGRYSDASNSEWYPTSIFTGCTNLKDIFAPFASSDSRSTYAPWGAPSGVRVHYSDTTTTY